MPEKKSKTKPNTQPKTKVKGNGKISLRATLLLLAMLPMLFSTVILAFTLINKTSSEMNKNTSNSLVTIITETGNAFDYNTEVAKSTLQAFSSAPIVVQAMQNPTNAAVQSAANKYTNDFFAKLDGWEGIYIATWDTQVVTHQNEGIIGKTLREGDSLKSLQDSMLSADGVFNTGIITSPASGNLVQSLYYPVVVNGTPIGFVGGATYVNNVAERISDVSSLGLSTAYIYFVDRNGIMLYHPTPEKIGNPVENAAVKELVARIGNGEHPEPDCITYVFKGANKYAAYYIGENENYIAVLTADETDVMAGVNSTKKSTFVFCLVAGAVSATVAVLVERKISVPLTKVSEAITQLSTGDVTVDTDAKSSINETLSIITAFKTLRGALNSSMGAVKNSADMLSEAITSVDEKTSHNVESVSQITNAINEVATTSQSVAENAQTMAEQAVELGNDIETLNNNVRNLFEASQSIKNANNDASYCMKSVYEGANESVEAMRNISDKISETNAAIEKIGSAVQAIESIASQTNLLSLNASIEAARAGEAGRGFAVVAEEIRTLADSSAESAGEIKEIIDNVIALSNGTVDISNRVYEVVSKEQSDIEDAREKFNVLSGSVEDAINEIQTIEEMAGKLEELKRELTNSTSELGAISEELGASAEEVAASCQTVTEACTDTLHSATEMSDTNKDMTEAIGFFKL